MAEEQPMADLDIHTLLESPDLLSPIPDAEPTGPDLRLLPATGSVYHALREVRTSARNKERTALANGESHYMAAADWKDILYAAPVMLREQSKDLEVVAWLIEALTRVYGFRGVAAGFSLARQLVERFGEALHPQPDDEGKATQLAALAGLNGLGSEGALIAPLKSIPLTQARLPGPFSTWQCEQVFEMERITDPAKRHARAERDKLSREAIDQALIETTTPFLVNLHCAIQAAIDEYKCYQDSLDAYCDGQHQPGNRILDTLQQCQQTLSYIAGDRIHGAMVAITATPDITPDEAASDAGASPGETGSAEMSPAASGHGPGQTLPAGPGTRHPEGEGPNQGIQDRQTALATLKTVAAYFRSNEPHSPTSYAIEQVIYWNQLSLPELIGELIPDDGARERFRILTGIRNEKDH